jgi:hypothetical protein
MALVKSLTKCLIMILAMATVTACSNSVPTVEALVSPATPAAPKNAKNFMQLSAVAHKETLSGGGGFKGSLRVGQPTAQLKTTSGGGYKLNGTVTLQR